MKRYLPFIIVVVVALATFGSGTMLYRAKRPQVKNIPESQSVSARSDASAHIRGNPEAPVTLEEFGDFLGIKVTPTLFINKRPLESQEKDPEGLRAAINAALEEKSKSGA